MADRPDLVLWALWSRNRDEEVEGAYNHQTALSLYELSDLNPAKLHMTVPTDFRRNSEIPGILVLHYADLPESDVRTAQGFKSTRCSRPQVTTCSTASKTLSQEVRNAAAVSFQESRRAQRARNSM